MPKKERENFYKETLHKEVNKISDKDTVFLMQLINIIKTHLKRTGEH